FGHAELRQNPARPVPEALRREDRNPAGFPAGAIHVQRRRGAGQLARRPNRPGQDLAQLLPRGCSARGRGGDIPVKVGDLVTTSTMLTTLDAGGGLEVYVQVPTEQASKLKVGLPLAVLDSNGKVVAQSTIFFVSPQVDYQTQTILAKAAVPGAADARLRNQQYVQARITWGTHLAISVPVLSVVRQGASAFVDVAQPQGQGY